MSVCESSTPTPWQKSFFSHTAPSWRGFNLPCRERGSLFFSCTRSRSRSRCSSLLLCSAYCRLPSFFLLSLLRSQLIPARENAVCNETAPPRWYIMYAIYMRGGFCFEAKHERYVMRAREALILP